MVCERHPSTAPPTQVWSPEPGGGGGEGGGLQERGQCQGDSATPSVLPGPGSTHPGSPLPLLALGPMFCPHFACSVATVS